MGVTPDSRRISFFLLVWLIYSLALAVLPIPARAQTIGWIRQFGSGTTDQAWGVAVDDTGVYVVGNTEGGLPGQPANDAFVRKYDASGIEQWTREVGGSGEDYAFGVARSAAGVYVVGQVGGIIPGQSGDGNDAFVRKYDLNGNESWTRQFGSSVVIGARAVAADATGVYVVGALFGALPGQTSAGDNEGFVRKYDANGTEQWTRQFGSSGSDIVQGVAVDATGVYVGGQASAALPGQSPMVEEPATPLYASTTSMASSYGPASLAHH